MSKVNFTTNLIALLILHFIKILLIIAFIKIATFYLIDYNIIIMSAKEKEAAAKQTFTFLAPLTNEQPCVAGRDSA